MDKLKGIAKSGLHSTGDREIHRKTWKSDVKDMALRKNPDGKNLEAARNHTSAPLSSLKDPDSFGPPPKRGDAGGITANTPISPTVSTTTTSASSAATRQPRQGGWGAPVPVPQRVQEEEEAAEKKKPPLPYRTDNTGLRTDNLPKPPARRSDSGPALAPPPRTTSSPSPALPYRPQQQQHPLTNGPGPSLPPRMNEHPDEYTPPAPPPYQEATKAPQPAAASFLNKGAINRLGQSGVSVRGFGIGKSANDTSTQQQQQQAAPLLNQGVMNRLGQAGVSPSAMSLANKAHQVAPDQTNALINQGAAHGLRQAGLSPPPNFAVRGSTASDTGSQQQKAPLLDQNSINRLGQAGVSVAGFGIGKTASNDAASPSSLAQRSPSTSTAQGHLGQLSQLQQRFSGMNTGTAGPPALNDTLASPAAAAAAAHKKAPPPPPPRKKPELAADGIGSRSGTADAPPPLPLSSKPRPS